MGENYLYLFYSTYISSCPSLYLYLVIYLTISNFENNNFNLESGIHTVHLNIYIAYISSQVSICPSIYPFYSWNNAVNLMSVILYTVHLSAEKRQDGSWICFLRFWVAYEDIYLGRQIMIKRKRINEYDWKV